MTPHLPIVAPRTIIALDGDRGRDNQLCQFDLSSTIVCWWSALFSSAVSNSLNVPDAIVSHGWSNRCFPAGGAHLSGTTFPRQNLPSFQLIVERNASQQRTLSHARLNEVRSIISLFWDHLVQHDPNHICPRYSASLGFKYMSSNVLPSPPRPRPRPNLSRRDCRIRHPPIAPTPTCPVPSQTMKS